MGVRSGGGNRTPNGRQPAGSALRNQRQQPGDSYAPGPGTPSVRSRLPRPLRASLLRLARVAPETPEQTDITAICRCCRRHRTTAVAGSMPRLLLSCERVVLRTRLTGVSLNFCQLDLDPVQNQCYIDCSSVRPRPGGAESTCSPEVGYQRAGRGTRKEGPCATAPLP